MPQIHLQPKDLIDDPYGYSFSEANFEKISLHLESYLALATEVANIDGFIGRSLMTPLQLEFAHARLSELTPYGTPQFRMESNKSPQSNYQLRMEGVLDSIWEKIKSFFSWIIDSVTSLFGGSSGGSGGTMSNDSGSSSIAESVQKAESSKVEEVIEEAVKKGKSDPYKLTSLGGLEKLVGFKDLGTIQKNLKELATVYSLIGALAPKAGKIMNADRDDPFSGFLAELRKLKMSDVPIPGDVSGQTQAYSVISVSQAYLFTLSPEACTYEKKSIKVEQSAEISVGPRQLQGLVKDIKTTVGSFKKFENYMEKGFKKETEETKKEFEKIMEAANMQNPEIAKMMTAFFKTIQGFYSMLVQLSKNGKTVAESITYLEGIAKK